MSKRQKFEGQVVLSQEQYLMQVISATEEELKRILKQLMTPKAGRYGWTKTDLNDLVKTLEATRVQVMKVRQDPTLSLALTTKGFVQ